jgi:hypothetical protein
MGALTQALTRMDRAILAALPEGTLPAGHRHCAGRYHAPARSGRARHAVRTDPDDAGHARVEDTSTTLAPPSQRPLSTLLLDAGSPGEILVAEEDVERVRQYLALPGVSDLLPRGTELRFDARPRGAGAQLVRSLYFMDREPTARSTWARPPCRRPGTWRWCCAPARCSAPLSIVEQRSIGPSLGQRFH